MVLQQQVPIFGNPDIWQVLLEYEHSGKSPVVFSGYRLEWASGPQAEKLNGKRLLIEVVLFVGDARRILDHSEESIGRRARVERPFKVGIAIQHGELFQLRAKFPSPLPKLQIAMF